MGTSSLLFAPKVEEQEMLNISLFKMVTWETRCGKEIQAGFDDCFAHFRLNLASEWFAVLAIAVKNFHSKLLRVCPAPPLWLHLTGTASDMKNSSHKCPSSGSRPASCARCPGPPGLCYMTSQSWFAGEKRVNNTKSSFHPQTISTSVKLDRYHPK